MLLNNHRRLGGAAGGCGCANQAKLTMLNVVVLLLLSLRIHH